MHMKSVDPTCTVLTQHSHCVRNFDGFHKSISNWSHRHETEDVSSINGKLVRIIQDIRDRRRPAYQITALGEKVYADGPGLTALTVHPYLGGNSFAHVLTNESCIPFDPLYNA
jgi:hypothetical protein